MIRIAVKVLAFPIVSAVTACLLSCSIQDESLTTVKIQAPTAAECGGCHVAIYEEWRASKHAEAYTNGKFREQTFDHRIEACLPCHIPETVFLKGKPVRSRHFYREEGVTCIACHLVEGEHHGPFFPAAFTPHGAQADPDFYFDAALCGTCHQGTYETWSRSRELDPECRTCQECHMARVRRKITQATGLGSSIIVALHDEHDLRKHTFDARILPEEVPVEVRIRAVESAPFTAGRSAAYEVTVENRLPHAIPTGSYGYRRAVLLVEWAGLEAGQSPGLVREFYRDLDTHLKPGEACTVTLTAEEPAVLEKAAGIRVRLERVRQGGGEVSMILDETVAFDDIPSKEASSKGGAGP